MIRIKDTSICSTCQNLSCSFLRTGLTRQDFCKLTSETTVCPTQILSDGPYESALKNGIIDKDASSKKLCINCGLCIMNCPFSNLEFCDLSFDLENESFSQLTSPQLKAAVTSYLGFLFTFAANTNRHKALLFDGIIYSSIESKTFVEIDWNNDSLECTRRLLGDFLTYKKSANISSGLIVLHDLPSMGNRDVYNVLEKIKQFPTTQNIKIFITSIQILRWLALFAPSKTYEVFDVAYNPISETKDNYLLRLNKILPDDKHITIIKA